jgi:hypothetical protein
VDALSVSTTSSAAVGDAGSKVALTPAGSPSSEYWIGPEELFTRITSRCTWCCFPRVRPTSPVGSSVWTGSRTTPKSGGGGGSPGAGVLYSKSS